MRCVISGPLNSSINDSQLSSSERLERGTAALILIDLLNASHTQTRTLCRGGGPMLEDVSLLIVTFLLRKEQYFYKDTIF